MKNNVLLSTAYLAPIQYYTKLISYDEIWIEAHENFMKQTYRNRCAIYGANGTLTLSIPIQKTAHKMKINEVQIEYTTSWQKMHWKSIESAYRSSPFFEFYADDLLPFYSKKYDLLIDFNSELQNTILKLLNNEILINRTSTFNLNSLNEYDDFRYLIHPKKDFRDSDFYPSEYIQVFNSRFGYLPNLSIIDLLFNTGNDTFPLLKSMIQR